MTTISPSERSYIISGLSDASPTRLDGRALDASRPISVSYGDAPQASGSARVIIGGTEILAGVRLEVGDVEEGSTRWRCNVEVDVTPQAFPHLQSSALSLLSTQLASMISDHFIPSIPPLPILPPTKFFIPSLHLTVLTSSGALPAALTLAARAAFLDLRIPKTKIISTESALENEEDLSGIKAAVRRKGGLKGKKSAAAAASNGAEWELDTSGGGLEKMQGAEGLPVLITLNLVPDSDRFFLDATPQEELACPDRLHAWFSQDGKVCGVRLEGESGIDADRIKPLLIEAKRISEQLYSGLQAMASE